MGGGNNQDKVLAGWFALYDAASTASGRIDYDKLEGLQREYERAHPDVQERLLNSIGVQDNATLREFREARKQAQAYYDIPAYIGMSKAESARASRVLQQANEMVSFGQALNRQHAFVLLIQDDPEGVILAMRAAAGGSNIQRQLFRQDPRNAAFAKFYGPG